VRQHPNWKEPPRPHPHFQGEWNPNNTIYHGPAAVARNATAALRLTSPDAPVNLWTVPPWLHELGLTYHGQDARWVSQTQLNSARRGQEFVCDTRESKDARGWLEDIIAEIER
jgi:hypothetical protein